MTVDLVTLAQRCENAEAFETGVLELLRSSVGFDAAFFKVTGHEPAATTIGLDAATRLRAKSRGAVYAAELEPLKRAALGARGVAVDTEVYGSRAVQKTHYHREIASTVQGKHTLMAYVPWRGGIAASIMLGRGGSGFSAREKCLVESLLPTIGATRAAFGLPVNFGSLPAAPSTGSFAWLGARRSRTLASVRSQQGTLVVRDRAGFREMVARSGNSELVWTRMAHSDTTRSGWPYVELFHQAAALAKQRRRVLFIGSGGGVAVRQFAANYPGIAIDLVECDEHVTELARRWFDLDAVPGLTIHVADGAEFVRRAPAARWDVIVIDAYDAATFATEFADTAFLQQLRGTLRAGGAIACNMIGKLVGAGPVQSFVLATRSVFDNVRMLPVVELGETAPGDALRNVVVVATRRD